MEEYRYGVMPGSSRQPHWAIWAHDPIIVRPVTISPHTAPFPYPHVHGTYTKITLSARTTVILVWMFAGRLPWLAMVKFDLVSLEIYRPADLGYKYRPPLQNCPTAILVSIQLTARLFSLGSAIACSSYNVYQFRFQINLLSLEL